MYLRKLKIWNFRRFGGKNLSAINPAEPDLHVSFQPGLNLLVGENDSGKSAIVDAIKLVLKTQSREPVYLEKEDFFRTPDGSIARKLRIECKFENLTTEQAGSFLEWLTTEKSQSNGCTQYSLLVWLEAEWDLTKDRLKYVEIRAGGEQEGIRLEQEPADLLRTTYLRPLRDADMELTPKRRSRLSQILASHTVFQETQGNPHELTQTFNQANTEVEGYFGSGKDGEKVMDAITRHLVQFSVGTTPDTPRFGVSDGTIRNILEKLSLKLEQGNEGLGSLNRLFMAAELILLNEPEEGHSLKLALIEEIEAHLHPQSQLRVIEHLQALTEEPDSQVQLILTSHSPILASKVKLKNLILCNKDSRSAFPMGPNYTELEVGDYSFLERFLDATKANLFFAKAVMLVEGDAENLLLPTLAKLLDRDFSRYGVSIVNIGSTAFKRYARIFMRKEGTEQMEIKVACITDSDLEPTATDQERQDNSTRIKGLYEGGPVKVFVSPVKTMEYDLALSDEKYDLYLAGLYADKIKNSDKYGLTESKIEECGKAVEVFRAENTSNGKKDHDIAADVYALIENNKAITAQCFADILQGSSNKAALQASILSSPCWQYLVEAIEYATEPIPRPHAASTNNGSGD
ncbi:MAG: AAA family ATPase [Bacteroidia bacterium]|nr:AAA family ATPase [Bacteroidia bacterium]